MASGPYGLLLFFLKLAVCLDRGPAESYDSFFSMWLDPSSVTLVS